MIEKSEVLKLAEALSLQVETVEKDYILGWMLDGIFKHPSLGNKWLFKGGTSLKKCFFETFRFSEDLDFTVAEQSHLNEVYLLKIFKEIADELYESAGIEFSKEMFKFKIITKEKGKLSAQGQIHYNGPLRRKQGFASIKLDLTTDEIIVLSSEKKKVHHPYTDEPTEGIWSYCYAFEEVVAEKIRALAQRARPRDVYDVVHFFRNRGMIENPQLVYNTLQKKCSYKGIPVPTFSSIEKHEKIEELESQWHNMLAHQLPSLPTLESFWSDISPFFDWLNGSIQIENLVSVSKADEVIFQPGRVTNAYNLDSVLQKIQFAAANRTCIKLKYQNKNRIVEPLSFRRAKDGNRLFYGFERDSNKPKAYSLHKIENVSITNTPYTEKYPVEISGSETVAMPPVRLPRK